MKSSQTVLSVAQLENYRYTGDEKLEKLLNKVHPGIIGELWKLSSNEELFAKEFDASLHLLVDRLCVLPENFDKEAFDASSAFFSDNMQQILMMLGLVSLPYCYGGIDGSKVLVKSERILSDTTTRLMETGTFVLDVCSKNAFEAGGRGFLSCLKVRLIHQFVRQKLISQGWDQKQHGIPVSQLDQAGTNLSFSLIALRAIRKAGAEITDNQMQSYIYRWNVISVLLGLDMKLAANNVREASVLSANIEQIQFGSSEEGKALTDALLRSIAVQAGFDEKNKKLIASYMSYLIGSPVADHIGLHSGTARNGVFEINQMLTKLKSVFKWIPAMGFENKNGKAVADPYELVSEIPLIHLQSTGHE